MRFFGPAGKGPPIALSENEHSANNQVASLSPPIYADAMSGPAGLRLLPGYFGVEAQRALVETVMAAQVVAPLCTPRLPRTGAAMSVMQTNLGPLGWVTDQALGYRYQATHPETSAPWPPIPQMLLDLWDEVSGYAAPPEACLINLYRRGARMGLHQDADEDAQDAPVVSVSLGDIALFRVGGPRRGDPTRSFKLTSGDVIVLGGEARRCFHGVDRVMPETSRLIPGGGRINLTLRRVTVFLRSNEMETRRALFNA